MVVSQKVYDNNGNGYSAGGKVPKDQVGNITIEIKYYEPEDENDNPVQGVSGGQ